jgi:hypothetical protein
MGNLMLENMQVKFLIVSGMLQTDAEEEQSTRLAE